MDRVLSCLGLSAWFHHAYFEYHSHVRSRFELAAVLGLGMVGFLRGAL